MGVRGSDTRKLRNEEHDFCGQTKGDRMGGAYCICCRHMYEYRILVGKPEEKKMLFGRPRRAFKNNI